MSLPVEEVKQKIEEAQAITILSHINPDADALGTALGIFHLLRTAHKDKRVEIVNASTVLPLYLDFLPNFQKIKHKIDYDESLIITCDSGSLDRLGFEVEGREIINIDHHYSNTMFGSVNAVLPELASSSQVAFELFKCIYSIDAPSATCFYTALLSDTRYFTTSSVNEEVFSVAKALVVAGADPFYIARNFTQRKPLSAFRILERALGSLTLHQGARVASMYVTKKDLQETGASVPDMDGIVDYARSLTTVEIALFVMDLDDGLRISLRSKEVDISLVAGAFGGGGHKVAAGFTLPSHHSNSIEETIESILKKIEEIGLLG